MDGAVSACRCLAFVGRATMLYSMSYSVCSFVINALYPKEAAAEEDVACIVDDQGLFLLVFYDTSYGS